MLVTYQKWQVEGIWEYVEPFIKTGLERGSVFTLEQIREGLLTSNFQLWVWQKHEILAVLVTAVIDKACVLLCSAGTEMREWSQHIDLVEDWAKSNGCERIRVQGRKGWSRVLGYTIEGKDSLDLYIMEKSL